MDMPLSFISSFSAGFSFVFLNYCLISHYRLDLCHFYETQDAAWLSDTGQPVSISCTALASDSALGKSEELSLPHVELALCECAALH